MLALLADAPDAEVALRRRRLAAALAEFDAATIATTHQFCGQMLTAWAWPATPTPDAVFVESLDDLVAEVVDDFYVRKFAARGAGTAGVRPRRGAAPGPHARSATRRPGWSPPTPTPASTAQVRFAFATAVRAEVERRKRRPRRAHLRRPASPGSPPRCADPARGAAARLRARYRVVLVDEFQDTDPVQWADPAPRLRRARARSC